MRRVSGILITVIGVCAAQLASAASRPDSEVQREVCVVFSSDVLSLPTPSRACLTKDLHWIEPSLNRVLVKYGVREVAPAYPRFRREDTLRVNPAGIPVRFRDLSRAYLLRVPHGASRAAFAEELRLRQDVVFVDENAVGHPSFAPNEPNFTKQWNLQNLGQYSGSVGADVDATAAWALYRGSATEQIAIVDGGVNPHEDFGARLYGDIGSSLHATVVAGVAAATGNNGGRWAKRPALLRDAGRIRSVLATPATGAPTASR